MCGIAGIINFKKNISNDKDILENMVNTLIKRGPDSFGYYYSPNVLLGHRRLVVVDPKGGIQPMTKTLNGYKYTIVYNGELYNTEDLRKELINNGFKEATEVAIDKAINLGKSFLGIFSGEFDSIAQIKKAIEKGGLIDTMSDVLDTAITWAQKSKLISSSTAKMIKSGKKEIMKNIKNGIDSTLEDQVEAVEKIDKYIEKWYKYYEEENFTNMEYQYKKITEYMEKVVPIEKTINAAKEVETLHEYIKENGKSFELSEEQKELCKMLSNY